MKHHTHVHIFSCFVSLLSSLLVKTSPCRRTCVTRCYKCSQSADTALVGGNSLGVCVLQDLTATLVSRAQAGPTEVVEELKARLALKEKLFQELLSDRSRQSNEHQAQVQDLLNTLSSKDQYLQVGQAAGLASSDENLTGRACTSVDPRSSFRITLTGCPW